MCTDSEVIEAIRLPSHFSAQQAELCALIRACELSANIAVNIYTDSNYAFGVVHDKGAIWKMRGFLTSAGTPITSPTGGQRCVLTFLTFCIICMINDDKYKKMI